MTNRVLSTTSKENIANDTGAIIFPCPKCGFEIVRSSTERKNVTKYTCPQCKFTGPN